MKTTGVVYTLRRVLDIVRFVEKKVGQVVMALIVLLVFVASIFRTIGYPLVWSVDLAQLLFVWVCFLGADIGLQQDRHIGVDILTRALPQKLNQVITFVSYLLILGFLIIVIGFGTYLAFKNTHRLFNGMPISYSWATISAPFGCLLLGITIIEKMTAILRTSGVFVKNAENSDSGQSVNEIESTTV
jgi:TRAP-type C4-dicarboxylate transport system permease small subunit